MLYEVITIAGNLIELDDYYGAKVLLEKGVNSSVKNFGLDDPRTSRNYADLANVLRYFEEYEKAKELFEKALEIDKNTFGMDHPTTASRFYGLAMALKELVITSYSIHYTKLYEGVAWW